MDARITVRLPTALLTRLRQLAQARGQSLAAVIRQELQAVVERTPGHVDAASCPVPPPGPALRG